MLRRIAVRARALVRRRFVEAEVDEELRYHLDREVERHIAQGFSPHDARVAARRVFGNVGHLKEEVRDSWRVRWLEEALQDVRFALRGFRRAPSFVLTVVLTIALGLGLNTAAFTIFDSYVLRRVAVRDPASLYEISWIDGRRATHRFTWRQYEQVRTLPVAAGSFAYHILFARNQQRPMFGSLVSGDYFGVLGGTMALGRPLLPEEAVPPAGSLVMVLSYDAWQGKFGGDSAIVGRQVIVRGLPLTVVGVAARRFTGLGAIPPDFWAPITLLTHLATDADPFGASEPEVLRTVIRLRPGVDEAHARTIIAAWAAPATATAPDSLRARDVTLMSLAAALPLTAETLALFAPVFVAFGLVMLIACTNIANVMLARGIARQREIGVRLALGAGRARIVRQLLTESVLLALPAALLGFLLSRWAIEGGVRLMFASAPKEYAPYLRVVPFAPDVRVFGFVLIAALVSGLVFGLVPAVQATRANLVLASRGEFGTTFGPARLRGMLVVAQIGVCSLLLIVTGILLRGADTAMDAPTGMRTTNVVQIEFDDRGRAAVLERLRAELFATRVGASAQSPLDGSYPSVGVSALGTRRVSVAAFDFVDAGFFDVLGISLLRGRAFTEQEVRDVAPVAIVSEATAALLWPGRDPLGQVVQLAAEPPRGSRLVRVRSAGVVAVSRNAVSGWIGTRTDRAVIYYPASAEAAGMKIVARVGTEASQARERIDREIAAVDPSAVYEIHTMDDFLAMQRWPFRVLSWVALAIGGIALLLTIIGIYGVLSYLIAQRTREIGIRMALGATVEVVVGLVVRQSVRYASIGIAIGTVIALGVSKLFAAVLTLSTRSATPLAGPSCFLHALQPPWHPRVGPRV